MGNLQFLQKLFEQAAVTVASSIDAGTNAAIHLEHVDVGREAGERFLHNTLVNVFENRSHLEVYSGSAGSDSGIVARFKILKQELLYTKLRKSAGLPVPSARRQANLLIDFDVRNRATGKAYFQDVVAVSKADTIATSVIPQLEISSVPLTTGTWTTSPAKRTWMEPVILTVVTGAIIYAFYSLRTQ